MSIAAASTVVYTFDPTTSGGVAGTITTLVGAASTSITADLDLTKANFTALNAFDGNCTNVTEYTWHIHTKWANAGKASEFLTGCSLAKTANHYDPDFACGPNSDFNNDPKCANKTYGCNATAYAANPGVCEKGDLSGKLGRMKATSGKISATWTDNGNYPTIAEHMASWNIMLHAVCGAATPRFVCANARVYNSTNNTSPSPTITAPSTTSASPTTSQVKPTPSSATSVKVSVLAMASVALLAALF
ncbi:hypothetical protein H310_10857 [Aphanomyces invadans]|uniref:Superoxide dismutase copper/zinc binding domain-containing protein n=1 Tax=Aphanomyces invadans TaxID=157072 RepID=A0A024TR28_9STRA|nr:hypothetical protein H310_10857 [Aphanomyces invadans]ETV95807.1 hypothetical protein H310_10857 [Aphanomyces invadans]RHY27750.1 hypothetical protein DYB32_006552 [Aphanomyces invadans]|eukprot:XP_008875558.1 hypothetical protein H310_10857 [Aphanomyces invadans]